MYLSHWKKSVNGKDNYTGKVSGSNLDRFTGNSSFNLFATFPRPPRWAESARRVTANGHSRTLRPILCTCCSSSSHFIRRYVTNAIGTRMPRHHFFLYVTLRHWVFGSRRFETTKNLSTSRTKYPATLSHPRKTEISSKLLRKSKNSQGTPFIAHIRAPSVALIKIRKMKGLVNKECGRTQDAVVA